MLRIELRASHMLGKVSTTKLYSQWRWNFSFFYALINSLTPTSKCDFFSRLFSLAFCFLTLHKTQSEFVLRIGCVAAINMLNFKWFDLCKWSKILFIYLTFKAKYKFVFLIFYWVTHCLHKLKEITCNWNGVKTYLLEFGKPHKKMHPR